MTIIDLFKEFSDNQSCVDYLERVRWNNEPTCPYCSTKHKTGKKQFEGFTIKDISILYFFQKGLFTVAIF